MPKLSSSFLRTIFSLSLLHLHPRIELKTFSHVKAKEITAWLNEHKIVEKYVVIDDLDLKNEEINAHLIRTNGQVGITEDDAICVIDMLN